MHDASIGSLVFFFGGGVVGGWWKRKAFSQVYFFFFWKLGKKILSNSLLQVVVFLNVPFEITGLKQMLFQNW